jgi:hypothetical protein
VILVSVVALPFVTPPALMIIVAIIAFNLVELILLSSVEAGSRGAERDPEATAQGGAPSQRRGEHVPVMSLQEDATMIDSREVSAPIVFPSPDRSGNRRRRSGSARRVVFRRRGGASILLIPS